MNIIFMGTPLFAVPSLKRIIKHVTCVYTQPPRPKNRGHQVTKSPVHEVAETAQIPVYTPSSLKTETLPPCDLVVVVAYGLILPQHILETPRLGCWNVHGSLLPRWRGAAPIQRAIMAGDTETGITLMQMDAGLDTGDMMLKRSCAITTTSTFTELHDELSIIGADLLEEALWSSPKATPQPLEGVTYADKIRKEEGILDLSKSAEELLCMIRALNPWPGTKVLLEGVEVRILQASPGIKTHLTPGTLFDTLYLACGHNQSLKLEILQKAGGKPLDVISFMRGFKGFL